MSISVLVWDERFESGPIFVGEHKNVPADWSKKDIMDRYGLGEHLCVYREADGKTVVLNHGDRYDEGEYSDE